MFKFPVLLLLYVTFQNDVERNIAVLTEKNEEIKNVLSRMENREQVDIDEAVVPTTPLYRQYVIWFLKGKYG